MAVTPSEDGLFDEAPVEPSAAPPPPPPPPPTPAPRSPGDTDQWMRRTISQYTAKSGAFTPAPKSGDDLAARVDRLARTVERLDREMAELKGRAPGAESPARRADESAPLREQLAAAEKALEEARAQLKQATEENERLEGELQSLRLVHEESREKSQSAVHEVSELRLAPEAERVVKEIVLGRDRLAEEKAKLERELSKLKTQASKKIAALKAEVEKAARASETVRVQKDNLMRELQARDEAAASDKPREITLEDITGSEIFKHMLGNIRRTTRSEVTTLHDAIAVLRGIDPRAYEVVLEVVAKQFQKAQIENPLATLPRA